MAGNQLNWQPFRLLTTAKPLALRGRYDSRSKDVHDLAIFLPKADPKILKRAIKNCFEFRETELPTSFIEGVRQLNTSRLERGWDSAVSSIPNVGTFTEAFVALCEHLEEAEKHW